MPKCLVCGIGAANPCPTLKAVDSCVLMDVNRRAAQERLGIRNVVGRYFRLHIDDDAESVVELPEYQVRRLFIQ